MSNHGPEPFEGFPKKLLDEMKESKPDFAQRNDIMRKLADATDFRGALGEYTHGKISKDDEGAIQFALGEVNGKVVIDFGTQVHWLAMTPEQAADLASSLLKHARQVGRKAGKTIAFTIG